MDAFIKILYDGYSNIDQTKDYSLEQFAIEYNQDPNYLQELQAALKQYILKYGEIEGIKQFAIQKLKIKGTSLQNVLKQFKQNEKCLFDYNYAIILNEMFGAGNSIFDKLSNWLHSPKGKKVAAFSKAIPTLIAIAGSAGIGLGALDAAASDIAQDELSIQNGDIDNTQDELSSQVSDHNTPSSQETSTQTNTSQQIQTKFSTPVDMEDAAYNMIEKILDNNPNLTHDTYNKLLKQFMNYSSNATNEESLTIPDFIVDEYKNSLETLNRYTNTGFYGNANDILYDLGYQSGDTMNFWDFARDYYENNTQLSDDEVDKLITDKMRAASAGNPHFADILKNSENIKLSIDAEGAGSANARFVPSENMVYINPNIEFTHEKLQQTVLHELLHGHQFNDNGSNDMQIKQDLINNELTTIGHHSVLGGQEGTGISDTEEDFHSKYVGQLAELDPRLAEVQRAAIEVFGRNGIINPGDVQKGEKILNWFIDPENDKLPQHYETTADQLRGYIKTIPEDKLDNVIQKLADRVTELAVNTSNQEQQMMNLSPTFKQFYQGGGSKGYA